MSALAGNPAFIDALARRMGLNVEQMQALASQQTAGFTLSGSGSQVRISMALNRACLGPLFVHTVDKQDVVVFPISCSYFFPRVSPFWQPPGVLDGDDHMVSTYTGSRMG